MKHLLINVTVTEAFYMGECARREGYRLRDNPFGRDQIEHQARWDHGYHHEMRQETRT